MNSQIIEEPDYKRAKETAIKIIKDNDIIEPPIDITRLVKKYIGNIIYFSSSHLTDEYKNVSGFIDFPNNTIYLNTDDIIQRQVFTLAHELGHFILHKNLYEKYPEKYNIFLRNVEINTKEEKEANCFAAELLVPKTFLQNFKKKYRFVTTANLAVIFGVSYEMMQNREKGISNEI